MKITFIIGMIGVCLAIFVVLFTSNATFVSNFNEYASYDQVISDGAAQGFPVTEWGKLTPALLGIGYAGLTVIYTQNSVYAGGELQNPRKNMTVAIMGSLAVLAPLAILMAFGMERTFGSQFIYAMQGLFNNYAPLPEYPLLAQPSYNLFAGIAAPNTAFIFLMGLGFLLWPFGTMIFVFTFTSRSVMAWSFDRILPDKLSEVNEKYHTPTYAILFMFVLTELALLLYTYWPAFATFIGIVTVMCTLAYFVTAISGTIFPFRRPQLYKDSPADRKVAGIPLITIAGIIATIFMAIAMFGLFDADVYFAYGLGPYLAFSLVFPVGAIVVYIISRILRKKQGIDLDMIYEEIPPA
jgi:amino acid transporter